MDPQKAERETNPNGDLASRGKKMKVIETMVTDVVRETPDATTIVMFTGNDRLEYKPGHFLTINARQFPQLDRWMDYLEEKKGKREPPRAYSIASAPHEKHLKITVKEERFIAGATKFPPLLSPMLVRQIERGQRLTITGFMGPYTMPDDIESRTDHIVHICAGSGIVPNVAMMKHALENNMKLKHTLIYGNKTWNDVIYRAELRRLRERFPARVNIVHCLSRDKVPSTHGETVYFSRVTEEVLREWIHDPTEVEVFLCGPATTKYELAAAQEKGVPAAKRFLDTALEDLPKLGIPASAIHKESYG